jgi:hypothetical protein
MNFMSPPIVVYTITTNGIRAKRTGPAG